MTADLTTADILRAARGLIEDQSKWTTGTLKCDRTGRMCALGAVASVLGLPPRDYPPEDHPAVLALGTAAREALPDGEIYDADDFAGCVVDLNDADESAEHHAKVVAMFDAAIAHAEQS